LMINITGKNVLNSNQKGKKLVFSILLIQSS